ncbi:hypothetical protein ACPAVH_10080 [Enterobacteriaceae bacterium TYF_5]
MTDWRRLEQLRLKQYGLCCSVSCVRCCLNSLMAFVQEGAVPVSGGQKRKSPLSERALEFGSSSWT